MGVDEDIAWARGGLVEVERERLGEAVLYYLRHPEERRAIAKRGKELYQARRQELFLQEAVQEIYQRRGCVRPKA